MQNTHIEGLEALMSKFGNIVEEVRRKPYDLLDASKTIFDRDFLEFNVHISDLEASVQVKILTLSLTLSVRVLHAGCGATCPHSAYLHSAFL